MYVDIGKFKPGSSIFVPFHTFDSNDPSASVTITGLATSDIEVYRDASMTQRASDAGYALVDTDGIDLDSTTGIHGVTIDTSDNTTAGFWRAGSDFVVVIASITVDAATVNFIPVRFRLGYEGAIQETSIATLASQTSFTLTAGSGDNDAYNGCPAVVHDIASGVQMCIGYISDYVGSTLTVTLAADPGIFTMAAGDNISIFMPSNITAVQGTAQTANDNGADLNTLVTRVAQTLNLTGSGNIGIDWANVENPGSTVDLAATDFQLVDTCTTNTDMRGTDSAFLAANAPTNFADLSITATTGRVDVASIEGADATDQISAECDTALTAYGAPTYTELLNFVRLLCRSDAAIATDLSTEQTAINADLGSGAGDYSNQNDSLEANQDDAETILADTNELQTDWADGGRLDLLIDQILADTNELQSDDVPGLIAALNDPTTAAIATAVLDSVVETQGSYTLQQAVSIVLAVCAGVTGTNGSVFSTPNGVSTRVTATINASQERTAMSLTPSA